MTREEYAKKYGVKLDPTTTIVDRNENVGDPADPLACDNVLFGMSHDHPWLRIVLRRGDKDRGHISLTLAGMEALMFDLAENIERCRKHYKLENKVN